MHAVLIEDNGWHAAQCLEIDIASQGNIREEAMLNLKEALTLHFQTPVNSVLSGPSNTSEAHAPIDLDQIERAFDLETFEFQHPQIEFHEFERNQLQAQRYLPFETLLKEVLESNTFRKIRFKLEAKGLTEVRQLDNHAKFVRRGHDEVRTAILPHYLQICPLVLRSILTQAGLSGEEFDKL